MTLYLNGVKQGLYASVTATGDVIVGDELVVNSADIANSNYESLTIEHDGSDANLSVAKGGLAIKAPAQYAQGTLTLTGLPTATETFVINSTTCTAVASGASTDEFNIGADAAATAINIAAMVNAGTEAANVKAWASGDTVVFEWLTAGTAGNSIVLTEALTNATADGSGTLGGTHAGIAALTLLDADQGNTVTLGKLVSTWTIQTPLLTVTNAIRVYSYSDDGAHLCVEENANNCAILTTYANRSADHNHDTLQTDPTWIIHSATAPGSDDTQYRAHHHNQTDSVDTIGKGAEVVNHIAPVSLDDEASFTLPDASTGYGFFMAGDNEEYAQISWTSAGVVTLIANSANVVAADTDTNLCFIDGGTQVSVKNRLGAAKEIMFDYHYTT